MTWLSEWGLTSAAALGAVAFAILLVLLVGPQPRVVPKHRRRPAEVQGASALGGAADRLTGLVDRAMQRRSSGLAERLDVAGIRTPASHLVVLTGSAALAGVALGLLLGLPALAVLALVGVPGGVWAWIRLRTERRRSEFARQLDETAQMLAGSLRSGYSFAQAVATVGREAVSPTNDEFTRITNETRLGRPLGEALERTADRMKSEDFSWIGQAVAINREVGGNLADVLDGVSRTIRERAQLRRQVASLSSEGRLSAIILVALPFVIIGVLGLANPTYIGQLFTSFLGWLILAVAAVLLVIGSLWLRAVVRIEF